MRAGSAPIERRPTITIPRSVLAAAIAAEIALTLLVLRAPTGPVLIGGAFLAGIALLAAAHLLLPAGEREPLLVLLAVALLVRLTVLAIVHQAAIGPGNPHGFLTIDSFGYDRVGWHLAQHWRHGLPPRIEYQTGGWTLGYHYLVAWIYVVAGHVPLLIKLMNALLSASLVPLTFLLGRELAGRRAGFVAAFLIAWWPPLIVWSVQVMKDVLIAFLLIVSVLGWIAFARRPRLLPLITAVLPALPLIYLRGYLFAFWMAGVAVGLLLVAARSRRPLALAALLAAVAAIGGWAASPAGQRWTAGPEDWVGQLSGIGIGGGSLFENVTYRSPRDVLLFLPAGVVRFLLTPLPWRIGAAALWPEALGSVLRYALLPFAALGLFHLLRVRREAVLPVLICGCAAVLLYAAAFRGGVPRHMIQFYPYFFVFAAAGLPRWRSWPLPIALGGTAFLAAGLWITRS